MTKAVAYIRCSGAGQMEKDGPIRQRQAIEAYAKAHNLEIVSWYEEAHTGSDLDGRISFREMRAALVADGVRTVIVEKLDRLARSVMVQETILADFKKNAIELLSTTPGEEELCSDDPTRTIVRQILAAFFEYERKMIVAKLAHARQRKKSTSGRCEGRLPYGLKDGEKETLDTIMRLTHCGYGASFIAKTLNTDNVKSRYGKPWKSATVQKIILREVGAA